MADKITDLKGSLSHYSKTMSLSQVEHFNGNTSLKLTGVSFDGRQENLKWVSFDTPLRLYRDRSNKFDFYAVMVQAKIEDEWKDIGFIPSSHNRSIAEALDNSKVVEVSFESKYGGDVGYAIGMKVLLTAL